MQLSSISLERGKRLKSILTLAGLSALEFAKKHKLSIHTLHAWRAGTRTLSLKGAQKLSQVLKNEGWFCTPEWLLYGKGLTPIPIEKFSQHVTVAEEEYFPASWVSEDFRITKEVAFFTQVNPEGIALTIDDESMHPLYTKGDLIAGVPIKREEYGNAVGYPCIIDVRNLGRVCRMLHRTASDGIFQLSVVNLMAEVYSPIIHNPQIQSLAPIIWCRRHSSLFISEGYQ